LRRGSFIVEPPSRFTSLNHLIGQRQQPVRDFEADIISDLIGGGVLGQIVTLLLPAITAAAQSGNPSVEGIISQVIAGGAGGAILTAIIGAIKNKAAA
jgi:hypothetical protein